jgi:hypothetical protein
MVRAKVVFWAVTTVVALLLAVWDAVEKDWMLSLLMAFCAVLNAIRLREAVEETHG